MVKAAEISDFWYPRYVVHAVSVYLIIPNGGFISKETERELYRTARVMLLIFKCLRAMANLSTFSVLIYVKGELMSLTLYANFLFSSSHIRS